MKVVKHGEQRLFETDAETAAVVTRMLLELERDGMDAVPRYSLQFDEWAPASFRLSDQQIAEAISQVSDRPFAIPIIAGATCASLLMLN